MTTASSYSALVQELYVAYFGRPADAAGLANFENALLAANAPTDAAGLASAYGTNAAVKGLIDSFGTSAESVKLYGAVSSDLASAEAFVTAVFEHVLNRAPAAAGLAFWSNAILTGSLSVGNAALSIAVGAQTNTTAQGKLDAEAVANKLSVAAEFTAAVGDAAGVNEYKGSAAADIGRALLANVNSATDPVAYQTSVQSAVTSLLGAGAPYNLTTGIDNLTGTTSNNLFNAVLDNAAGIAAGGAAATLNSGDTVVGGPGVNTLNINDEGLGASLAIPKNLNLTNITDLTIASSEAMGVQDFSTWSGLNAVVVTKSVGSAAVTVGNATSLNFTDTGAAGSISTVGGSSVAIHTDAAHSVSVKGGSGTASVTVTGGMNIQIVDGNYGTTGANSIASVAVTNPANSVTIESSALTALSVTGAKNGAVQLLTGAANALALSLNGDSNTIVNENARSLALTTSGAASTGIDLEAPSATLIALSLGANLTLPSLTATNAASMTISGAGSFSGDLRNLASSSAIDASKSSGTITATIGAQASFHGGSGQVQLTETTAPTVTLDGGSAVGNTINFQNVTVPSNTVLAAVKDFATWEISGTSSGTFDMKNAVGVQALDVQGLGGNLAIANAAATLPLTINLASGSSYGIKFATADSAGASDTVAISLGSTTSPAQSMGALTLQDASGNGIGALTLASNSNGSVANTIASLNDSNLRALTLSGNTAVDVAGTLTDTATSLTITNSAGTSASILAGLTDTALTNLNFAGSQATQINAVSTIAPNVTLSNTGSGAVTISAFTDGALVNLTAGDTSGGTISAGNITAAGLRNLTLTAGAQLTVVGDASTAGITVSGSNDNAAVSFTSIGATASGATDSVTLGNGSDQVTLGAGVAGSTQSIAVGTGINDVIASSTQGKLSVTLGSPTSGTDSVTASGNGAAVNITAGNGSNHLVLSGSGDTVSIGAGTGANTIQTGTAASGAVSFATHTASDVLQVGAINQTSGAAPITIVPAATGVPAHLAGSLVVTGMNAAATDSIVFGNGTISAVEQVTVTEVQSAGADTSSLAGWIAAATGKNGVVPQSAGGVVWFQQGGNTYVIDTASAGDAGVLNGGDSVIELTGAGYSFGSTSIGTNGTLLLNGGSGNSTPATAVFTLTTGTDSFTGNALTNTFNATLGNGATLNAGDVLTGGASGSVNILNIVDSGTGGTMAIPGGATIGGMTVLNIQSSEAVGGDYSSWSKLGTLNVTASVGTDNVTVGNNVNVTIVDAGTTVDLTGGKGALIQDANFGTATTNTLATAALTNLSSTATLDSNALASLTIAGSGFGATVNAAAGTRTLGLTLDGAGGGTFTDATATTVNITAATSQSNQAMFSFAAATGIAVSDSAGLNDSQTPWTAQQSFSAANAGTLTLSGAGLFAANLSGLKATATIDASASSGTIDVALAAGQSFTGGSGADLIAVTGTPTGIIDGGTAVGNEIVLVNDGAASVSALAHVSHVEILGVSGSTSGTFDMASYTGGTSVTSFDVNQDTAGAPIVFTNAAQGSTLRIEGSFGNNVTLQTADITGSSDAVVLTLGTGGGGAATVNQVTLMDGLSVGLGSVSLHALSATTISTLYDTNIGMLNFSGSATTIGTLHDAHSTLTVSSSDTAATISALTVNSLNTLTMTGAAGENFGTISSTASTLEFDDNNAAAIVIGTLSDSQLSTLTLQNSVNTSNGTFSLTSGLDAPLMNLTLNGNVGLTVVDSATPSGATGITVAGQTDNAVVSFSASDATPSGTTNSITLGDGNDTVNLSGGAAGSTHSIILGKGADSVTDGTAGTSNITVTGANGLAEHETANAAASVSFTLGDGNNTASALNATTVSITAGNGNNGITVSAATTLTVSAGNGANTISATAAGASGSITVGTGANTIAIGDTGNMSITLGAHTGVDAITVGVNASNTAISSIAGTQAGDTLTFSGDSAGGALHATQSTDVTANSGNISNLSDWISASLANSAQHQVAWFQFGGNTYLVEQSATGNAQTLTGDTIIELIGAHDLSTASFTGHALTLA
ncbi:MAG TPA: DUF4214 domain-containing protein [Burkholderiaceae bacterium]